MEHMHNEKEAKPQPYEFLNIGVISTIFGLEQQDTLRKDQLGRNVTKHHLGDLRVDEKLT